MSGAGRRGSTATRRKTCAGRELGARERPVLPILLEGRGAMSELDRWTEAVRVELGLEAAPVDPKVVLDLARDVAHGVDRPAAPLTTYLLGLAVTQGHTLREV